MKYFFFCIILLCYSLPVYTQSDTLSFHKAFGYSNILKKLPDVRGWIDEEHYLVYTSEDDKSRLMKINARTGGSSLFLDYDHFNKQLNNFNLEQADLASRDRRKYLFNQDNDLYLVTIDNLNGGKAWAKRLTWNDAYEMNPRFSPDYSKIAYTKDNDLYVYHIEKKIEQRLTYDGGKLILNGKASWVYMEEIIGRSENYKAFWWSPDGSYIAFLKFDDNPVLEYTLTNGLSPEPEQHTETQRYPFPGTPNPGVKLCIFNFSSNKYHVIDDNSEKDVYIAFPFFKPDEKKLYYQRLNRGQDTLEIIEYDTENYNKRMIYDEIRKDWVNFVEKIHFVGNGFILRNDKSGWSHFYHYDWNGKLVNQITRGNWNAESIEIIDEENKEIFFTGYKDKSTELHLYKVNLDGGSLEKITKYDGVHSVSVSPQGSYIIDSYSSVDAPKKMILLNDKSEHIRELGDTRTEKFNNLNLGKLELFTIPAEDGYELPSLWYLPPDFDENKKYPVIFSIYGGPEHKSVKNSYRITRSKFREFWLAQNGIITIVVDHRGAGHFGRKGMAEMHRNLGKWELNDLISAVKWLKSKKFIDTTKIGITGGSYGGYVTALALTKGAGWFTHGIAAFSVTDWRLYDNVYTERYMDTPAENPEGYANSRIMKYTANLRGKLFLAHGDMDDNVHCRHTLLLADKLISDGKKFKLQIYPDERHGFGYLKNLYFEKERIHFWFDSFGN